MTDSYRSFDGDDHDAAEVVPKRCFTPIPSSRRFLQTQTLSLCPSMDLMVVGSSSRTTAPSSSSSSNNTITTTLALHRTMNPQKLSHKTLENIVPTSTIRNDSSNAGGVGNDSSGNNVACCWRSDGRVLAVVVGTPSRAAEGEDGTDLPSDDVSISRIPSEENDNVEAAATCATLQLYAVEEILKEWHSSSPMSTVSLSSNGPCCAMTWAFRGKSHPSWELSVEEEERQWNQENVCFPIQLPPSEYHLGYTTESLKSMKLGNNAMASHPHRHNHHHDMVTPHVLPSPSHLSVLALVTLDPTTRRYNLSVYLYGRFPWILDLPLATAVTSRPSPSSSFSSAKVQVAVSNSLSHVVVVIPDGATSDPNGSLSSSSLSPLLVTARIPITPTVASLAATTIALEYHLTQLQSKVSEITAVYVSSLKPQDSKLEVLSATLERYSIPVVNPTIPNRLSTDDKQDRTTLASCLASWIVGSSCNPDLTSALEQYFASVQMNDQLLVRMDQSLTVAMANVETQIHQLLLSPCRAMVVQTSELVGTILAAAPPAFQSTHSRRWSDANACTAIVGRDQVAAARRVHQLATNLHQSIEQVRTDVVSTRFLLRDWIQWLRSTGSTFKARGTPATSPLHQHAIQRRVPDAITQRILTRLQQQSSPSSTNPNQLLNRKSGWTEHVLGLTLSHSLIVLPPLLVSLRHELHTLFQEPRQRAKADVPLQTWKLGRSESSKSHTEKLFALTTRLGAGWSGGQGNNNTRRRTEHASTCFVPKMNGIQNIQHPKEWIFTANAVRNDESVDGTVIDLCALPLVEASDDDFDAVVPKPAATPDDRTVWMVRLQLTSSQQHRRKLIDIEFYGDNGKSSLSAMDGGSGQERRQALALLVENKKSMGAPATLELWLINYDKCPFAAVPLPEETVLNATRSTVPILQVLPRPASGIEGDDYDHSQVVYAKSRTLSSLDASNSYRLVVNGSRGVGAVLTNAHPTGTTIVDLYDLEEDEEEEEEDEGDDMSTE